MANKWAKALRSNEAAVDITDNPFAPEKVLKSPSPSLNWVFGKPNGLPKGSSIITYGPAKAGKSLISYLFSKQVMDSDPEGMVIRFDTEMRSKFQSGKIWGLDPERFIAYDTNKPAEIFDFIVNDVQSMLQDGMPLKMIVIDSLTAIQGVREANAAGIESHQIGDNALTIQKGLKMILPVIRRHNIGLFCTSHIRANLEAGMYGSPTKMAGGFAQKHYFEFFMSVKRDGSKEGKADVLGNSFENSEIKDLKGNKEITGHKIYATMEDSSLGTKGRSAEFTLDYSKGLINVHEEVFFLGINTGAVERPNNRTYIFEGQSFSSKAEFVNALKDNEEMQNKIMKKVQEVSNS
jgi:hypothetical protein